MNPILLPLAVTCTALYLGLGLLPFAPAGNAWGEALALWPGQFFSAGFAVSAFLPAMALGFVWQAASWPRAAAARVALAGWVFFGLIVMAGLLQLGQIYFLPRLASSAGLLASMPGFAAGMALWWLLASRLNRRLSGPPGALWPQLVIFAALSVLLPLDMGAPIGELTLTGGLSTYVVDIPQRFYLLIKSAILWAPVGFIFSLSGRGAALPSWGVALFTAWALLGLPLLWAQPLREVLELLFALPGLWAGAWLGGRSRLAMEPMAGAVARKGADTTLSLGDVPLLAAEHSRAESALGGLTSSLGSRLRGSDGFTDRRSRSNHLLGITFGLGLLSLAVFGLYDFPRWQAGLALGFVLYLALLWLRPLAWLVVLPAAIPLLDLAPWTGRFFLDEFDLLMLATAGMLMLRPSGGPTLPSRPLFHTLAGLFLASCLVSGIIGLQALPPIDANAFASYWSGYNSVRLAKGFIWAGLFYVWIRRSGIERHELARLLTYGMGLGLLGIGLVGAWEHHLFVGFAERLETYRIVSLFSSMHTGGGHIEAYLVAALPFLWLGTTKLRHLAVTGPLTVLTAYVMLYTVARGGVLALGVTVLLLLLASGRIAFRSGGRRFLAPVGLLLGVGLLVSAGIGGGYFQQRFAATGQDWQTRVTHWIRTLDMMDSTPQAQLFGMGLGSFPRVYLERGPADTQPASFGFASQGDNTYFRLGAGATVYYAQRIPFTAGRNYRLELDARAASDSHLNTPVCEKQMLNSRQCAWMSFSLPGNGQWHRYSRDFSSAEVGARDWLHRPPVELFLYNPDKGTVAEVDNVRLIDLEGRDLLCNGDFSRSGDCWFFKTHSHLPWHIKNVWVHVLFEQGWFGLLAFTGLTLLALTRLARAGGRGHRLAWTWMAALAGLLSVGMFDSLLDAPRLSMLLVALLLLGSGWNWGDTRRASSHSGRGRSVN